MSEGDITIDLSDEEILISKTKKVQKRNYCAKKFTYLNLLGLIGIGVIVYLHWYRGVLVLGPPPTFLSSKASDRLLLSCITAAGLEIVGFFALNQNLTSLGFAMVYLFAVTRGVYDSAFIVSRTWASLKEDDFHQVIEFSIHYQNKSDGQLPPFIANYQRRNKCCGWGKYHWLKWANEFNNTDLPDSCCKDFQKGCGKGILPKYPTGYTLYYQAHNEAEYQTFLIQHELAFRLSVWDLTMKTIKDYWKKLHPNPNYQNLYQIWNPADFVPHSFLRLVDEEFAELQTNNNIVVILGGDRVDLSVLLYQTKGMEEKQRIQPIVHAKPCEKASTPFNKYVIPEKHRGVNPKTDNKIIKAIQKITRPMLIYGLVIGFIHLLMFFVYFSYFQKIKAVELAISPVPVDFQDTEVTSNSFMSNPFNYLERNAVDKLNEEAAGKRMAQRQAREVLEKGYNEVLALHETGVFQKKNKVKQPRAPENPDNPAQVHKYQRDLIARLPLRLRALQAEEFTLDPTLENKNVPKTKPRKAGAKGKAKAIEPTAEPKTELETDFKTKPDIKTPAKPKKGAK